MTCSSRLIGKHPILRIYGRLTFPSDHILIKFQLCTDRLHKVSLDTLITHAEYLGKPYQPPVRPCRPLVRYADIDSVSFADALSSVGPVAPVTTDRIILHALHIADSLYDAAKASRTRTLRQTWGDDSHRWENIISSRDSKTLWASIGWDGKMDQHPTDNAPSDEMFQAHFEDLLNQQHTPVQDLPTHGAPEIPVLDGPITYTEYLEAASKCKPDKAPGCDGIPPGIFRLLPVEWILYIVTLFNIIFTSGCYPAQWCFSRLVTVFKKGQRSLCSNYRGIAVTDSITKLFDCILNNRLKLWYRPTPEQAGAQSGRSCQEQILALRLLIAYAVAKKVKLWIMFVDFSKAYDRVPRYKLLDELKLAGCGKRFLLMLKAMYMCTKFVLRSAIICASAGVKQGAPLSCLLFVFYVDIMVKKIRSYGPDGFLGLLHSLLLMDDTAVVSTSRQACVQ